MNLKEFGGIGDGVTLNTEAFQKAISRLTAQGGGRLVVPQGMWLTGPIRLESNIELHLDRNAIIYMSPDKRLYLDPDNRQGRCKPSIFAEHCKNIAITGNGIIDGNGADWYYVKRNKLSDYEWKARMDRGGKLEEKGSMWFPWQMRSGYPDIADNPKDQESMRNDLIRLTDCENVLVEGVTIQNSPRFHLHPCYCTNVIIDGVSVRSEWNVQNGDGIDLSDCHQALIVRSTVSVGDDGICMKSGMPSTNHKIAGCEDIVVEDNTVFHAHGGFVLGSETASGMRRIVVRHNRFSGTDVGLRFKSSLDRGGKTEQLFISDIQMNDIAGEAISFQCDYVNRHAGDDGKEPQYTEEQRRWAPNFQDIHISRVVCRGAKTGIKAAGIRGMQCVHDIDISDCTIVYHQVGQDIDPQTAQLSLDNVRLIECKNE